jgi:hypothetical protein
LPHSPSNIPLNDLAEIVIRSRVARHLAEGFADEFPSDIWREVATAFTDIPALSAEITQLRASPADPA